MSARILRWPQTKDDHYLGQQNDDLHLTSNLNLRERPFKLIPYAVWSSVQNWLSVINFGQKSKMAAMKVAKTRCLTSGFNCQVELWK